jgi:hypothetical protein
MHDVEEIAAGGAAVDDLEQAEVRGTAVDALEPGTVFAHLAFLAAAPPVWPVAQRGADVN